MEKLQLSNGEQIEILNGASLNAIRIEVSNWDEFKALKEKFTDDNLAEVSFLNEFGIVSGVYEDKTLSKNYPIEEVTDDEGIITGLIVTFTLKDVDKVEKTLKELNKKLEETQATAEVLTTAIAEIGSLVGGE